MLACGLSLGRCHLIGSYPSGLASTPRAKRDSTALVAVTFDKKTHVARLSPTGYSRRHRAIRLTSRPPSRPRCGEWHKRYRLRKVLFDPFQMVSVAQRLAKANIPDRRICADGSQPDGRHQQFVRSDSRRGSSCSIPTRQCGSRSAAPSSLRERHAAGVSTSSSSSTRSTWWWR